MALTRNMTISEIVNFLDKELLPQVKQEIGNWIYPNKKKGGYFTVTRQIFCMIDFLGAVYMGYLDCAHCTLRKVEVLLSPRYKKNKIFP